MQRRLKLSTSAALLAAAFAAGGPARAEAPDALPLTSYVVDDACPAQPAFEAQVLTRLSGRPVTPGQMRLGVEIVQEADATSASFTGRLHVGGDGAMASTREVQGASCADVIEALALLAALSLETRAAPEPAALAEPPPTQAPPDPPDQRWQLGPLALALTQSAAAPEGALGAGVGVALQPPAHGVLKPWVMLALYRTITSSASLPDSIASARFNLTAVYAVGCPVRWPVRGWWSLRPCADIDLGRLKGRGVGSDRIETRRGLWASVGLAARAEMHVWGPLSLAALVGGVVPLARHEFYFAPEEVVFRVPATGWRGAGFVSLMF